MYSIDNRDAKSIEQKVIKLTGKMKKLKLSTVLSQQLIELDRKSDWDIEKNQQHYQPIGSIYIFRTLHPTKSNIYFFSIARNIYRDISLSHKKTSLKFLN